MVRKLSQHLINHVGFVYDGSGSMSGRERDLVLVADNLIEFLKSQSVDKNQETRVTMYVFGSDVEVTCYDVDVLRTPSIKSFYNSHYGMTALRDATCQAIEDMRQTATLYGDHAFLLYVLTDGQENASKRRSSEAVRTALHNIPNNWTVAALVPDSQGRSYVEGLGFHKNNVLLWDSTTSEGVQEVGRAIEQATANYFDGRLRGVTSTNALFHVNTEYLEPTTLSQTLQQVDKNRVQSFVVESGNEVIRDAVASRYGSYRRGSTFYQLTKTEEIQPQKKIVVRDKATGDMYEGAVARQLLGLPNAHTRVAPPKHPQYDIFVQSTSPNRKLIAGTTALVF